MCVACCSFARVLRAWVDTGVAVEPYRLVSVKWQCGSRADDAVGSARACSSWQGVTAQTARLAAHAAARVQCMVLLSMEEWFFLQAKTAQEMPPRLVLAAPVPICPTPPSAAAPSQSWHEPPPLTRTKFPSRAPRSYGAPPPREGAFSPPLPRRAAAQPRRGAARAATAQRVTIVLSARDSPHGARLRGLSASAPAVAQQTRWRSETLARCEPTGWSPELPPRTGPPLGSLSQKDAARYDAPSRYGTSRYDALRLFSGVGRRSGGADGGRFFHARELDSNLEASAAAKRGRSAAAPHAGNAERIGVVSSVQALFTAASDAADSFARSSRRGAAERPRPRRPAVPRRRSLSFDDLVWRTEQAAPPCDPLFESSGGFVVAPAVPRELTSTSRK